MIRIVSVLLSLVIAFSISSEQAHASVVNRTVLDRITSGLIGHWTFDGSQVVNGVIRDSSPLASHGNPSGISSSTFYVPGALGQAVKFDNVNDFVNIGDVDSYDFGASSSFTVSLWVKVASVPVSETIIAKRLNASAVGFSMGLSSAQGGSFTVSLHDGTDSISTASVGLSGGLVNNKWHHLVMVVDRSSNVIRAYADGVAGSVTPSISTIDSLANTQPLRFAAVGNGSATYSGHLDDVRIYNRIVTAAEVTTLYNLGAKSFNPNSSRTERPASGLVAHWTFDGGDIVNGVVKDMSRNGVDGNHSGIATSTFYMPGAIGQGVNFDGVNDFVRRLSYVQDIYAASFWFKPASAISNSSTVMAPLSFGGTNLWIAFGSFTANCANEIIAVVEVLNRTCATGTYSIDPNKWHHLVISWNGSSYDIILDGTTLSTVAGSGGGSGLITSAYLNAGSINGTTNFYKGLLDDVRIYNRALTSSEITALANMGSTTGTMNGSRNDRVTSGLVGYWSFDGKDMLRNVADVSGNGNNGFMTNFTSTSSAQTPGRIGQGLRFDGVDDVVSISHHSSLNPSEITIAFWAKILSTPLNNNYGFIDKNSGTGYRIRCGSVSPCTLQFTFNGTSGAESSNLTLNKWTHVVVVGNSSGTRFYIDGVPGTLDADAYVAGASSGSLKLGQTLVTINAAMDDVRIYNRALPAEDISQLFNLGR